MPQESAGAACPKCGGPIHAAPGASAHAAPAGRSGILGGSPTPADVEATARPHAERAARAGRGGASLRCASCGETLYQIGTTILVHRGAAPVLTMAQAADRLRNHLRRLAITRLGRIDGDCYLLPYMRLEGRSPDLTDTDETFLILAASLGEERLEAPHPPAADLKPFETPAAGAAGASGTGHAVLRVLAPSMGEGAVRARAESRGFKVHRALEWVHYPMWLMRVEDNGRLEGAWMDGIEGRFIQHRLRLAPPVPSLKEIAGWTAIPAAVSMGAVAAAPIIPLPAGLLAAALAWAAVAPALHASLFREWRG